VSRLKAAFIHLLISIVVFSIFISIVYFVWYPSPFSYTQGITDIVYLMASVDIVLGPLLTLVVFNSTKKSLKFDLTVIAVFQLGALIYGSHIIYSERPAWIVFANNQFEVVGINEIDQSKFVEKNLRVGIFSKPKEVFVIEAPLELRKKIIEKLMLEGKGEEREPTLYRAFEQHIDKAVKKFKLFSDHHLLTENKFLFELNTSRWTPVIGKEKNVIAIADIDKKSIEYLIMPPSP